MKVLQPKLELHSTRLWKYLNTLDPNYADKASNFIDKVAPILDSIKTFFPYYTRHDAHHGFNVLKRMEDIVEEDCFVNQSQRAFSADEAFLLICSAYAHDLGMAVFPNEKDELLVKLAIKKQIGWETNSKLQNFLRVHHSERGGAFINDNHIEFGIPANLVFHLHQLMRAHNLSISQLDSEFKERISAGRKEVDLRQLACILCIADALEYSETRVVDGVVEALEEKLKTSPDKSILVSYRENMKHVCIGDNVGVGDDGKIIFSGNFKDPEILNLAHQTIDYTEDWLRGYIDIDFNSIPKRLKLRGDSIFRSLRIMGCDFERLGIRLKKDNIIELISSNSVWQSDKAIVLRELLQNSVEACRYRRYHSSFHDNYQPFIKVICNRGEGVLNIVDNGCGMSRNIILNNFLTIGNSRSFDSFYTTERYSSLARFGIGFWSVFTIADHAKVKSAPFEYLKSQISNDTVIDGLSFDVSINEAKDYTVFNQIKMNAGTEVSLKLKEDVSIDDIIDRLNYHIACSEIPIEIVNEHESFLLPKERELPTLNEIFGAQSNVAKSLDIKEFIYEQEAYDISFKMKILYRIENGKPTFKLPNQSLIRYINHRSLMLHRSVSICGFLSNFGTNDRSINIESSSVFVANTNNPSGYTFTLNRLGLLPSQKTNELSSIIKDLIYNSYRSFLKFTNAFNAESIYELNKTLNQNGGEPNHYTSDTLNEIMKLSPDLICFKLYKLDRDRTLINCKVEYLTLGELLNKDYEIWSFNAYTSISLGKVYDFKGRDSEIYGLIISSFPIGSNAYFIGTDDNSAILSDNDPSYSIYTVLLHTQTGLFNLGFGRCQTQTVSTTVTHEWNLGNVRGIWSGYIFEREIHGANFSFHGQYKLFINKNSKLTEYVKGLLAEKKTQKVCTVINLLEQAYSGFIDPKIKPYL